MRPLFPPGKNISRVMGLVMLALLSSFILSRIFRESLGECSYTLAELGHLWFGFSVLAVSSALFTLLLQGLLKFIGRSHGPLKSIAKNQRLWAAVCLLLSASASAWSFVEARSPSLQQVHIASPHYHGRPLKILQISDVHLGTLGSHHVMQQALKLYQQAQPDMLVITGDFVDGSRPVPLSWSEPWRALKPALGKFAVLGNHESLGDQVEDNLNFIEQCGLVTLRNQGLAIENSLYLAGVDDSRFGNEIDESTLWPYERPGLFRLLLKHRPDVIEGDARGFDLQLSGHTHGGQLYPGYWFTKIAYPRNQGLYELRHNSYLYVDKGIGSWGPPMRFLTPPQATLIVLSSAND